MDIETKILKTLEKMPLSLQEELLHYAQYLQEKYSQSQNSHELQKQTKKKTFRYFARNICFAIA